MGISRNSWAGSGAAEAVPALLIPGIGGGFYGLFPGGTAALAEQRSEISAKLRACERALVLAALFCVSARLRRQFAKPAMVLHRIEGLPASPARTEEPGEAFKPLVAERLTQRRTRRARR